MARKTLQIQQINSKLEVFTRARKVAIPSTGWIKAIRTTLGMSMQQLGTKLSITKQSVQDIERREQEGSITLKSLRETADALDMDLVYGLVPKDGSLDKLIDRKANELATRIVMLTSDTMKLGRQDNSENSRRNAIEEKVVSIKNEMPKILWD